MSELKFEIMLPANHEKLFQMATDYKNIQQFFTRQIESIKVINSEDNRTTTEETLVLTSFVKAKITQQTIHEIQKPNIINSKVISGPFVGSTLSVIFDKKDDGSRISVTVNFKVSLKYKILTPMVKKYYKIILTGLLYKMNTIAMQTQQ